MKVVRSVWLSMGPELSDDMDGASTKFPFPFPSTTLSDSLVVGAELSSPTVRGTSVVVPNFTFR